MDGLKSEENEGSQAVEQISEMALDAGKVSERRLDQLGDRGNLLCAMSLAGFLVGDRSAVEGASSCEDDNEKSAIDFQRPTT